jgi:hypothetical protein
MLFLSSSQFDFEGGSVALLTAVGAWFQVSHTSLHLLHCCLITFIVSKQAKELTEHGPGNSILDDITSSCQSIPLSSLFSVSYYTFHLQIEVVGLTL